MAVCQWPPIHATPPPPPENSVAARYTATPRAAKLGPSRVGDLNNLAVCICSKHRVQLGLSESQS